MSKHTEIMRMMHRLGMPDEATMTAKGSAEYAKVCALIHELIEAAREASATLGHIYHTTPLRSDLEEYAHDGYQRLDVAIAAVSPPKPRTNCEHSWSVKMVSGGPIRVCQNCGIVPPDAAIQRAQS